MEFLTRTRTIRQALIFVIIGIFLFIAAFSITIGMQTDERGAMSDCPFMFEQASVCSMGVFEHIAKWRQFFSATFSQSDVFASLIFLFLTFVFLAVFVRAPNILPFVPALSLPIFKNRPETKLYNHLKEAFSQGILNPKIYDFATL